MSNIRYTSDGEVSWYFKPDTEESICVCERDGFAGYRMHGDKERAALVISDIYT